MKMTRVKRMAVLSLVLASFANADIRLGKRTLSTKFGGLVGNGGGMVVCRDPQRQISSIELLDFYEARTLRKINIDIASIPGDWKAKANGILLRIRAKSEMRYQLYTAWLSTFEKDMNLLQDVQFSTVPDSGYIGVPPGCDFEQAAIQRRPMFTGDSRYYINATLWNAMDDAQKAGLVVHEIVYREALGYTHTDSIRSRFLVGLYASDGIKNESLDDYLTTLSQAHFELADIPVQSALIGQVSTSFYPIRIWQVGEGEDSPISIKLNNEWVIKIGDCVAQGCEQFTTHYLDGLNLLAYDFGEIKIGDTELCASRAIHQLEPVFKNSSDSDIEFYISSGQSLPVQIFLKSEKEETFSANSPLFHAELATNLSFELNVASSSKWESVTANYLEENFSTNPNVLSKKAIFSGPEGCGLGQVDLKDVIYSITPHHLQISSCLNDTADDTLEVTNQFSNGSSTLSVNPPNSGQILYDPNSNGRFFDSERIYAQWVPELNTAGFVTCLPVDSNCLKLIHDANFKVSEVQVVQGNASVFYTDLPPGGWLVPVKTGSRINLFPDGLPKNFTISVNTAVKMNGKDVTIPAGAKVQMDEQAKIISFR